jgi:hypothetical protein
MRKFPESPAVTAGRIAPGSIVCVRRDDGGDATLLRRRATSSRAADCFVTPKAVVTAADNLTFLRTVAAEGATFALVRTAAGIEGFIHSKYVLPHKSSSGEVAVKVKGGGGGGAVEDDAGGVAAGGALLPFDFDVEWVERWSLADGSTYYNTKTFACVKQRPDCFPPLAPLQQCGPVLLRSKAIIPPAFIFKSPSPLPSPATCFIDPEEPAAFAFVSQSSESPSRLTFPDFFASLQKFRTQLGGSRGTDAPQMKRYTGTCQAAHCSLFV